MKFLLDTNFIILYLKGDVGAVSFLKMNSESAFFLNSISQAELFYGAFKSKKVKHNLDSIQKFFSYFPSYSFDERCSQQFGVFKTELEKSGTPVGILDIQIASIAKVNDCVVVTRNLKEFSRMSGLDVIGF